MTFRSTKKKRKELYLDDPIGIDHEGNELTLMDILGTEENVVLDEVEMEIFTEKLYKVINKLQKREQTVLTMRYGLPSGDRKTQKEVAKELGISRSYISRIEKKAISKIAEEFR